MKINRYPQIGEVMLEKHLENGLAVFLFPKPDFGKSFAFFATNYGGMDTRFSFRGQWQDTPMGVAHFLEHKMFDTKDGNALQVLSGNGASPNAFTGSALTGYYFEGSEGFYENLETLLSFVSIPYFTQESVEKEQGIIGQEIRMIQDNPNWQVYMGLMSALYENHTARNSVAGTQESIAQISAETLYHCHEAFYRPSNMVLCIAGDVEPEKVLDLVEKILPQKESEPPLRDHGGEEPETACEAQRLYDMEVSTPIFQLGVKLTPPAEGAESLRQRLLGELLCEALVGSSSPLYEKLYARGLINNSFFCGYETYPGCAFLIAGGESKDPKTLEEEISREARRLCREGIDPDLFRRLKKAAYGSQVRALNSFEHLCVEQARAYFAGEELWLFPQIYATIEKEDVEAALGAWITPERTALSVVRPKGARA